MSSARLDAWFGVSRPVNSSVRRHNILSQSKVKGADTEKMNNPLIERTLIIMSEPIEWILSGRKVWELRSKQTKIRERIALSEKGAKRIVGVCTLKDCVGPLSVDEFIANARKMNYKKSELEAERKELKKELADPLYAWVLADVKRLAKPIHFENPSGAVTWAILPPNISRKLSKL